MKITELMKIEDLEKAIESGLVSKRKHPKHPLFILNYTAVAQFDWNWDEVTLNCRGLVIDEDYNIIARSFPKFFSYEQLNGELPKGNYIVEEKMDGSMLIVFKYKDEIITATRGSFESEQAIKAQEFLPSDSRMFWNCETWIFEIIYKDNRIVVDYDFEGLVLLGIHYNAANLWETPSNLDYVAEKKNFRRPKVYTFNSLNEILNCNESNIEGFVLNYENGERVKIKTDDYKRLHRLITGVSEKTVWEALKNNTFEQLIENVPDEFYAWVNDVRNNLEFSYTEIFQTSWRDFNHISHLTERKAFALEAVKTKYPQLMFQYFDDKNYSQTIWKMVKPEVTKVFKMVGEDSN